MHETVVGVLVAVCVFTGSMVGMMGSRLLPENHQTDATRDNVRLAIGMISILASLVLGLLTASAKQTFDGVDTQLRAFAADIIVLDETLRDYGPSTDAIRTMLQDYTRRAVETTWPDNNEPQKPLEDTVAGQELERLVHMIRELKPASENERLPYARAMELGDSLISARWSLLVNQHGSISPVLLVIMIIWVSLIFVSFGLFAPHNATVVIAFLICSISIGTSIFVILEMDTPFDGVIMVSGTAMKNALAHIGQ